MTHFTHAPRPDINELDTKTVDGQRLYETPDGELYPSVTTVLKDLSAEGIAAWRAKVGDDVANRISAQASRLPLSRCGFPPCCRQPPRQPW